MKETTQMPAARSWRDIPQNVKPRAMSREGRRRLKLRALGGVAAAGVLGMVGWCAWEVAAALQHGAGGSPVVADSTPVKDLVLSTDGVLDRAWLARTLKLPGAATLMGLDLSLLRARLLASGQVRAATLVRKFPATLSVSISERSPVARIHAQDAEDGPPVLLVARDGVAYSGVGYEPGMVDSLPWLDGVKLTRSGPGYAPIGGMEAVADLLSRAQLDAEPLYRTWQTVSLARLQSDGEIQVLTRDGLKVTFGTQDDFYRQIAKLDLLLDSAVAKPGQVVREINLSLGEQVSVALEPAPAPQASAPPPPAPPAQTALFKNPFN